MFEKLDKLRAEVKRIQNRIEEDKVRLKGAEQKLKDAENSQILADVSALKLTPEQLATFLAEYAPGKVQITERAKTPADNQEKKEENFDEN